MISIKKGITNKAMSFYQNYHFGQIGVFLIKVNMLFNKPVVGIGVNTEVIAIGKQGWLWTINIISLMTGIITAAKINTTLTEISFSHLYFLLTLLATTTTLC